MSFHQIQPAVLMNARFSNLMKRSRGVITRRSVLKGVASVSATGVVLSNTTNASAMSLDTPPAGTPSPNTPSADAAAPPNRSSETTPVRQGAADAVAADRAKRLQSLYLPMRDGVRIAVDIWLPPSAATSAVPTIIRATRYHRAEQVTSTNPDDYTSANEAALFNNAGYALVIVDARGSGASFGSRPSELSPDEIDDYGEILSWIGTQPWSNQRIGSYGVSYDATTAELMARTKSPYLKAIAPLFSDFDAYRGTLYPGGAYFAAFGNWLGFTQVMDAMDGAAERFAAATGLPLDAVVASFPPVAPVEGPDGLALRELAIRDHQANNRLDQLIPTIGDRDQSFWPVAAIATHRLDIEASGVAAYVEAGFFDANTTAGTLERFATFANTQQVWLAPWTHGGDVVIDPVRPNAPSFPGLAISDSLTRLISFMDRYVRDGAQPDGSKTLHVAAAGVDGSIETTAWPLAGATNLTWSLTSSSLSTKRSSRRVVRKLSTRPHTTGTSSRWLNQIGNSVDYSKWKAMASRRTSFKGPKFTKPTRICGFPVVTIDVACDASDATLFAYLEYVSPGGRVSYLTEGVIQLSHRGATQPAIRTDQRLDRSFAKADRRPMTPNVTETVVFEMVPTSIVMPKGSRLQVSFASSDTDNFDPKPTAKISITTGGSGALTLPIAPV
jgi:uncharacterized protein